METIFWCNNEALKFHPEMFDLHTLVDGLVVGVGPRLRLSGRLHQQDRVRHLFSEKYIKTIRFSINSTPV